MKKNKENVVYCQEQVLRLQGTRFYNNLTPIALKELRDALLAAAECQSEAKSIVTKWLSDHADYPTPADIHDIGRRLNQSALPNKMLPHACALCRDSPGYVRVTQTVDAGIFRGEERTAMAPCKCPLGRAIAVAFTRWNAEEKREQSVNGLKRPAAIADAQASEAVGRKIPLAFAKRFKEA